MQQVAPWLTPPKIAAQLGVTPPKVLHWIATGELEAIDVATKLGGRPRWRVSPESLEAFLGGRANRSQAKSARRRKAAIVVEEFFP